MEKRGQVAIFVIIAIVIVVGVILIYAFYPGIKTIIGGELNPESYLRTCIEPTVEEGIGLLSRQGGYAEPEGYINYNGEKVKYLCYNSMYFYPCKVQQPLLRAKFEEELQKIAKNKIEECVTEMKQEYRNRGYEITENGKANISVDIIPKVIRIKIKAPMTVVKDESTQAFEEFNIEMQSSMYELLMIATSIIDFESKYGNSETLLYTRYYPNLRIYKTTLEDGSRIYAIEEVNTRDKFTFAVRSLAWAPGYGLTT